MIRYNYTRYNNIFTNSINAIINYICYLSILMNSIIIIYDMIYSSIIYNNIIYNA